MLFCKSTFFVSNDPALSLLATFATYSVGLIMRPVGGAIFGNFGDKHGRKKAMIIIMGFSQFGEDIYFSLKDKKLVLVV